MLYLAFILYLQVGTYLKYICLQYPNATTNKMLLENNIKKTGMAMHITQCFADNLKRLILNKTKAGLLIEETYNIIILVR